MNPRIVLWLASVSVLSAAASRAAPNSPFAGDARLDKRVSVHAPMITLRSALRLIEEQSGVRLAAARDIAGDTIVLIVQDRPAREVLSQTAGALDYTWRRDRSGSGSPTYRLEEGRVAKLREYQLKLAYRREKAREVERWLDLVERATARLGGLSGEDASAALKGMGDRLRDMPVGPARHAAEDEFFAAEVQSPGAAAFASSYRSLPAPLRDRLLLGERIILGSVPPAEAPLPAGALAALTSMRRSQPDQAGGDEPPDPRAELVDLNARVEAGQLFVRFQARRLPDRPYDVQVSLPRLVLSESRMRFGRPLADDLPGAVVADRPNDLSRPVRFVLPAKNPDPANPLQYCQGVMLSDALEYLSRTTPSLPIAGDAYFKGLRSLWVRAADPDALPSLSMPDAAMRALTASGGERGTLPLGDLLKALAMRGNTNARLTEGGWLRFRSTTYFEDRDGAVDPDLLVSIFQPVVARKPYSPGVAMNAADRLTYPQAAALAASDLLGPGGLRFLAWSALARGGPHRGYDGWRLMAGLDAAMRDDLIAGRAVSAGRLSPAARARLVGYLRGVATHMGPPLDLEIAPVDLPSLTLRLGPPSPGNGRRLELRFAGQDELLGQGAILTARWPASRESLP